MRLGDAFDGARVFGRPRRIGGSVSEVLEYPGFELEFKDGRLVCVKFDVDDAASVNVGDIRLSRATKPLDVQVWFGDPSSDSGGGADFRWIDFERGTATLALEFDARGLTCVQLYAQGYA